MGKEFDALLINPKASDSPIDLFGRDFNDTSDVSKKKKLNQRHLFPKSQKLPCRKQNRNKHFHGIQETLKREARFLKVNIIS